MTIEEFDAKIWPLMSEEEITTILHYSMFGLPCPNEDGSVTFFMGQESANKYYNFRQQMIEKYTK